MGTGVGADLAELLDYVLDSEPGDTPQ